VEKVLFGCFLFFGAGSQFFFGYIENYVLQYVATMGFMLTGWAALDRRISINAPILWYIVSIGLHLGNVFLSPCLIVLLLYYFNQRRTTMFFVLGGMAVVSLLAMYLLGYSARLLYYFTQLKVNFLQPFGVLGGYFPYPIFSFYHLLDWFNLQMLLAPFGFAMTIILLAVLPKGRFKKNPVLMFLLSGAGCGLLFTGVVNTALGMARDWDVLAGFITPLMVLAVYLLYSALSKDSLRYVLTVIVLITAFHWAAWVGVNAGEERHLARMELLYSPHLLARGSQMFYDESLANFFFDNGNYADAKRYYEHYLSVDSSNPRIMGNISDVYRKLGDKGNYLASLKRAVEMNTRDPGIYSNLGVEYASQGDTNRAIEFNLKALELDPTQDKASANLAILYTSKKEYNLAQKYFEKAITLGMRDPLLFKYAADLNFFLNDYVKAVQYYDAYLSMRPDDQKVRQNRARAFEAFQRARGSK
jgi:hypothetical protein